MEALLLLETIVKNQIDYIHKNLKLPEEAIQKREANKKLDEEKHAEKVEAKAVVARARKNRKVSNPTETPDVIELPEKTVDTDDNTTK
ncbi:hypothetical protein FACS1894218_4100 [Bacilli bacterium]|nr:hypothetical protein FACS1894218_4100 [Bacilli bacterium]